MTRVLSRSFNHRVHLVVVLSHSRALNDIPTDHPWTHERSEVSIMVCIMVCEVENKRLFPSRLLFRKWIVLLVYRVVSPYILSATSGFVVLVETNSSIIVCTESAKMSNLGRWAYRYDCPIGDIPLADASSLVADLV